jgi:hypothetical protein
MIVIHSVNMSHVLAAEDSVHLSTERRDETGSAPLDGHYRTALTGKGGSPAILFEC